MADVLYPGRRPRPFRMGVVFDAFGGPNYPRAVELAKQSPVYRESGEGDRLRHHAAFDWSQARTRTALRDRRSDPHHRGDRDGKKVPYAREVWLPLY
jgi:hypothetical protein